MKRFTLGVMRLLLVLVSRFVLMLAGLYGLWLFIAGVMSVLITESHSFPPRMWSELVLGAAILAGSVFLWRERAQRGTGQQAHAADRRPSGAGG